MLAFKLDENLGARGAQCLAEYEDLINCLRNLGQALRSKQSMDGKLWIVSPLQIREYAPQQE